MARRGQPRGIDKFRRWLKNHPAQERRLGRALRLERMYLRRSTCRRCPQLEDCLRARLTYEWGRLAPEALSAFTMTSIYAGIAQGITLKGNTATRVQEMLQIMRALCPHWLMRHYGRELFEISNAMQMRRAKQRLKPGQQTPASAAAETARLRGVSRLLLNHWTLYAYAQTYALSKDFFVTRSFKEKRAGDRMSPDAIRRWIDQWGAVPENQAKYKIIKERGVPGRRRKTGRNDGAPRDDD